MLKKILLGFLGLLVLGAGIVWYFSNGILKRRLHDFKNWRHVG